MITFIGVLSLAWAFILEGLLRDIGQYDTYIHRWTDWFVVVPGYAGIGCLLYALYTVCARWLP